MASSVLLSPTAQQPNVAKTLSLLESCSSMEDLKQLHAHMLKTGLLLHTKAATKLLTLCASSNLAYAQMLFDRLSTPNTPMWNAMIRGYSSSSDPQRALLLYRRMLCAGPPHNAYTFPFLLKARPAFQEARQIHARLLKLGYASELHAANALLHVYAAGGGMESSLLLFNHLPHKDAVSWNSILNGYAKRGDMGMAAEIFRSMPEANVVSWTAMISGYAGAGQSKEALSLFHEMLESNINPDNVVLATSLSACAHLGALDQGRWIHAYITRNRIHTDQILASVLVDMYAKCGDMDGALKVFGKMSKRGVYAWTSMISGLALHGRGREALEWFRRMQEQGVKPSPVTITAVLTGCSHAGLVEEGKQVFEGIKSPSMEHYGCMVDLLGRAGLLEEASGFVEKMPVEPSVQVLGALVNACRIHGDVEMGKRLGKVLVEEEPGHGGRYVHLASIYAAGGEWERAVETRRRMKEKGVGKLRGCSVISVNGIVHEFTAGDGSHPEMKEIHDMWDKIAGRLRGEGYNVGER